MKYLGIALLLIACNSTPNLEGRVKSYMRDSVIIHFNDPKSYEYVSMATDSVFSHEKAKDKIRELQHEIDKENSRFNLDKIELGNEPNFNEIEAPHNKILGTLNSSIERYKEYLVRPDSLMHVNIEVRCRAKNAMGALILNTVNLKMMDNKLYYINQ